MSIDTRIPVVGGLGYIEHVRRQPETLAVTLTAEPENRYFRHAIAVLAEGQKIGYVAPEIAPNLYEAVAAAASPITCPARRAGESDRQTSGVEFFLDITGIPPTSVP